MAEPRPSLPPSLPARPRACLPASAVFGILFGLVAGIMVYISLKELLPGARRFDPKDKVTTLMTVLGAPPLGLTLPGTACHDPTHYWIM